MHRSAAIEVASQMKEYMKGVLKGKNSLESFVDKVKRSGLAEPKDSQCPSRT